MAWEQGSRSPQVSLVAGESPQHGDCFPGAAKPSLFPRYQAEADAGCQVQASAFPWGLAADTTFCHSQSHPPGHRDGR